MSAGDSAAFEAEHQRLLAQEFEHLADIAREMHRRFSAAAYSERRLAHTLEVLETRGYTILADRRWPKSRKAQIDFIAVGPGGVFIVDAKHWRDIAIVGDRVFRDQDDVTDDFASSADLAESTRSSLAELGLAPGEVHAFAVFTNRSTIRPIDFYGVTLISEADLILDVSRRGTRLTADQVNELVVVLNSMFSKYDLTSVELDVSVPEPVLPSDVSEVILAATIEAPPLSFEEIHSALVEGVMAHPIEEWMAFLHPAQAHLIRRNFSGPSRVRGAAGTGKTVVGLHRAAYLARPTGSKVLVTTYVRTLANVLSSLLQRLAPDVVECVEFTSVHAFASALLKDRGVRVNLDSAKIAIAFAKAWAQHPDLALIDSNKQYWQQEIESVIKGRGLTHFEQYAQLARIGRRRRLTREQRGQVWALLRTYNSTLTSAGAHDFADVILKAEASLKARPLEGYSAVVIDEAQDLSCAMIRMLHLLVGDRPDGLNLIGDGQQTIYPGGFTLSEAGVSISGRGVVMSTNYRNTAEIVEFASSVVQGDDFVDIEGGNGVADATATVTRHGSVPTIRRFSSRIEHDKQLVEHVLATATGNVGYGDIGVLTLTNWAAAETIAALRQAGIPVVELTNYDGRSPDAVKVGTIHRAKGLEFKHVVVARTPRRLLDSGPSLSETSAREKHDLDRRALYVAMTRARDGLWVGVA